MEDLMDYENCKELGQYPKKRKIVGNDTNYFDKKRLVANSEPSQMCRYCQKKYHELVQPFEYYNSYRVCSKCYHIVYQMDPEELGLGPLFASE